MIPVPRGWSDVTPGWATLALASRRPGAVVGEVRLEDLTDGTNARARAVLAYRRGDGPRSVFVKRTGKVVPRLALAVLGAATTEARLAASGVVLPLDHPRPFAGGVDPRRLGAVVVMEDVALGGGDPHDATQPLGVDQVEAGLVGLARLHAAFPASARPPQLGFLGPWHLGPAWAAVSVASLARGRRRLAAVDAAALAATPSAPHIGRQFAASSRLASTGPQCVLHGDPHPGNTYALPGGRTGFLDWQLARLGHWSHDVGYFLVGSLSVEVRRSVERDLLARYLSELRNAGGPVPGWGEAWDRYRSTPAFGLATWLHTLAFGRLQPPAACGALVARFAAAHADLETDRSPVADA